MSLTIDKVTSDSGAIEAQPLGGDELLNLCHNLSGTSNLDEAEKIALQIQARLETLTPKQARELMIRFLETRQRAEVEFRRPVLQHADSLGNLANDTLQNPPNSLPLPDAQSFKEAIHPKLRTISEAIIAAVDPNKPEWQTITATNLAIGLLLPIAFKDSTKSSR